MEADIQKAVDSKTVTPKAGEALKALTPGTFCQHKSWGFGQIASVDFLLNQITIDFIAKKSHAMQLQYAAESLQPLANDHLFAQKSADMEAVKARVQSDPVGTVRQILKDFGGKATQDQIAQSLVPDVLSESAFKKWWEATKKALRKDGHFAMPAKKSEPLELREEALSRETELLAAFQSARKLKDQVAALDQILKNADAFANDESQLAPVLAKTEETAKQNQRLHPAIAFELLVLRDEIVAKTHLQPGSLSLAQMLREEEKHLHDVLPEIPASRQKRILAELPKTFGEDWKTNAFSLMQRVHSARVVSELARVLLDSGATEDLRRQLDRWIRDHSITRDVLYWLCKERNGVFSDLVSAEVLSAILTAIERNQLSEIKRGNRLRDLLIEDRELIPDLLSGAEIGVVRDVMRKLILSPAFEELSKRSLLGRIIRVYPEVQSMIGGDTVEKEEALIVSWESLEKRKAEYEELVNKKIPENTRDIGIAREHGDLRENFEFKSAKEMQRVLMRRKSETEHDLARSRGTNFENPDTTQVSIGTIATVRHASGETTAYTILGAWDSIPEKNVISYLTAIGQALITKKVGDQVELPTEDRAEKVEIISIVAAR